MFCHRGLQIDQVIPKNLTRVGLDEVDMVIRQSQPRQILVKWPGQKDILGAGSLSVEENYPLLGDRTYSQVLYHEHARE